MRENQDNAYLDIMGPTCNTIHIKAQAVLNCRKMNVYGNLNGSDLFSQRDKMLFFGSKNAGFRDEPVSIFNFNFELCGFWKKADVNDI